MAFCNSCGATLSEGTKFCNKCGAVVTAAVVAPAPVSTAPAAPATSTAPATGGGSNALKVVLIVIGVLVVILMLGMVTCGLLVRHAFKNTHVHQDNGEVKVDTPFGKVETSSNPADVSKDLGVDIYPGAEIQKNGTATATFGSIHTVSAAFTTTDSLDKVCAFYKERFPSAMVSNSDSNHCNFISNNQNNMITVNAESSGDTVKVQISNVSKKSN